VFVSFLESEFRPSLSERGEVQVVSGPVLRVWVDHHSKKDDSEGEKEGKKRKWNGVEAVASRISVRNGSNFEDYSFYPSHNSTSFSPILHRIKACILRKVAEWLKCLSRVASAKSSSHFSQRVNAL
jgi:hypothetical protein